MKYVPAVNPKAHVSGLLSPAPGADAAAKQVALAAGGGRQGQAVRIEEVEAGSRSSPSKSAVTKMLSSAGMVILYT